MTDQTPPALPDQPDAPIQELQRAKHAGGRPPKMTRQMAFKVFMLAAKGLTDEEIAKVLEISPDTIFRAKRDVEFCGAISKAKDEADLHVINSLYSRAIGFSHPEIKVFCNKGEIVEHEVIRHYPPDTEAIKFWLMNRRREEWRREIQHEENKPKPTMIRLLSKIDGKEAAAIRASGNQMDVLLGSDFVAQVKGDNGNEGR